MSPRLALLLFAVLVLAAVGLSVALAVRHGSPPEQVWGG